MSSAEPPSIRDELHRKVLEEVEVVLLHQSTGRIGKTEALIRCRSLWAITAGLVDQETMDLISAAIRALETAPDTRQPADDVMVRHRNGKLIVAMTTGTKCVMVSAAVSEAPKVVSKNVDAVETAVGFMSAIREKTK